MRALFYFHLRVGVRVALRASPPLFCGIVAVILFQDSPTAFITAIARSAYSGGWPPGYVIPIIVIAFVLPAWGKARLSEGMSGWIRHLPSSDAIQRAGLLLALVSVQLPLIVMLAILAWIASRIGLPLAVPGFRWILVLLAGAVAGLFLKRGPRKVRVWRSSGVLVNWRIMWRAIGWRVVSALASGFFAIGAGWLFVVNNHLSGRTQAAALRLAGSVACAFCLTSFARRLAERRPPWPLSRSFPWSAFRRVADDSLFMSAHALLLVVLVSVLNFASGMLVLSVLPFMSVRAAEYVRRIPERRVAALVLLGEGCVVSIVLTLLPWTALLWIAATFVALRSARRAERDRRTTGWFELHHAGAGDTSSWN